MNWFFYGLASAFCEASNYVVSKRALRASDPRAVSLALSLLSIPWLAVAVAVTPGLSIGPGFWIYVWIGGALYGTGRLLSIEAIRCSPLSITIPLASFAPIFVLMTAPLILGEVPPLLGFVGILITFVGSYLLNIQELQRGLLEPFKALMRERGPRLMLLTAFIWGFAGSVDKLGVHGTSPMVWALGLNVTMSILTSVYGTVRGVRLIEEMGKNFVLLAVVGGISACTLYFYVTAVSMTYVAYASSVKRFAPLFSVIFGYYFFGETNIRQRLLGAIIMLAGVIAIACGPRW